MGDGGGNQAESGPGGGMRGEGLETMTDEGGWDWHRPWARGGRWLRGWWEVGPGWGAVMLVAVVILLLMAWRPLTEPGLSPLGMDRFSSDEKGGRFIFAELARMMAKGESLLWTRQLWFPVGIPFLVGKQCLLDAALVAPLTRWFGVDRALTVLLVLVLVSNTVSGAWLGRRLVGAGWPMLTGGLVAGASPLVFRELLEGRITQAWLAPAALSLGLGVTALRSGGRGWGLAGVMLGITALHYWFFALFMWFAWLPVALQSSRERGIRTLLYMTLVSILVCSPLMGVVLWHWKDMPGVGTSRPVVSGPWDLFTLRTFTGDTTVYAGQLGLVAIGAWAMVSSARGWTLRLARPVLIGFLGLLLISAGSRLVLGPLSIPLPYAAFGALPVLNRFWWPERAIMVGILLLIPLVGWAQLRLEPRGRLVLTLLLALSLGLSLKQLGPLRGVPVSPVPAWARAVPEGGVVVWPLLIVRSGLGPVGRQPDLGHPLVNGEGMVMRRLWSKEYQTFIASQPLLQALLAAEGGGWPSQADRGVSLKDAQRLAGAGVVAVVISRSREASSSFALMEALLGTPRCLPGDDECFWLLPTERAASRSGG